MPLSGFSSAPYSALITPLSAAIKCRPSFIVEEEGGLAWQPEKPVERKEQRVREPLL
jgi:hypothetical protein